MSAARYGAVYNLPTTSPAAVVITVRGDIDAAMAKSVVSRIAAADPRAKLDIRIDSLGGIVSAAQAICSALRAHKGSVVGSVVGHCSSAAILLLASCRTSRIAGENSRFRFHEAESLDKISGRLTASALRERSNMMAGLDARVARDLALWCGGSAAGFADLMNADTEIGAKRAAEIGLLTSVAGHPKWKRRREPAAAASMRRPRDQVLDRITSQILSGDHPGMRR